MLWPDADTSGRIERLWGRLEEAGVPTLASLTHRRHRPHASLIVGEHLEVGPVVDALRTPPAAPARPIPLRVEAVGAFPEGVLFLACVTNDDLAREHRRVAERVGPLVTDRWPWFEPGRWTPHLTLGSGLTTEQVTRGLALAMDELPIEGRFEAAGIEDGSTGDSWPLGS